MNGLLGPNSIMVVYMDPLGMSVIRFPSRAGPFTLKVYSPINGYFQGPPFQGFDKGGVELRQPKLPSSWL